MLATNRSLISSAAALWIHRHLVHICNTSPLPYLTGLFLATPHACKVWLRRITLSIRDRIEAAGCTLHANTLDRLSSSTVNCPLLVITIQTAEGNRTSLITE